MNEVIVKQVFAEKSPGIWYEPYKEHGRQAKLHFHKFSELVIVTKGQGVHYSEGGRYPVSIGDFFLIEPGKKHDFSNTGNLEVANLIYSADMMGDELNFLREHPGYNAFFLADAQTADRLRFQSRIRFDMERMQSVDSLLLQLQLNQEKAAPGWQFMARNIFFRIVWQICSLYESPDSKKLESLHWLGNVILYLSRNYAKPIRLADIAGVANRSISTVAHDFKQAIGKSIIQYLMDIRLEKASGLLAQTNLSLTEIAMQTGFYDGNYLNKMFVKHFHETPRRYRKRHLLE